MLRESSESREILPVEEKISQQIEQIKDHLAILFEKRNFSFISAYDIPHKNKTNDKVEITADTLSTEPFYDDGPSIEYELSRLGDIRELRVTYAEDPIAYTADENDNDNNVITSKNTEDAEEMMRIHISQANARLQTMVDFIFVRRDATWMPARTEVAEIVKPPIRPENRTGEHTARLRFDREIKWVDRPFESGEMSDILGEVTTYLQEVVENKEVFNQALSELETKEQKTDDKGKQYDTDKWEGCISQEINERNNSFAQDIVQRHLHKLTKMPDILITTYNTSDPYQALLNEMTAKYIQAEWQRNQGIINADIFDLMTKEYELAQQMYIEK